MRSYGWSEGEVTAYKAYREKQEMELLSILDSSLKAAIDALSDDLDKYLAEAGEKEFKDKLDAKAEEKKDTRTGLQKFLNVQVVGEKNGSGGALEPFIAIFMGFGEIIGAFIPTFAATAKKKAGKKWDSTGAKTATTQMKMIWTNYKKSHQLLTW